MIQGEHNGAVIKALQKSKQAARDYVRSIPVKFRAECVSVVLLQIKLTENEEV